MTIRFKEIAARKDINKNADRQKLEHNDFDKRLISIEERLSDAKNGQANSEKFALVKEDEVQDPESGFGKYVEIGVWSLEPNGTYQCKRLFKVLRPMIFNYNKKEGEKM